MTGDEALREFMLKQSREFAEEIAPYFAKGDLMGVVLTLSTRIAFLEARIVALETPDA